MSLINNEIIQQSAGNQTSFMQVLTSNNIVNSWYPQQSPFVFNLPTYGVTGGTQNYYGQDPEAIFTSLSYPFIRFQFTGNTQYLSGNTLIIHDFYKIKYSIYSAYNPTYIIQAVTQNVQSNTSTEVQQTNQDGVISNKVTTTTTNSALSNQSLQRIYSRTKGNTS